MGVRYFLPIVPPDAESKVLWYYYNSWSCWPYPFPHSHPRSLWKTKHPLPPLQSTQLSHPLIPFTVLGSCNFCRVHGLDVVTCLEWSSDRLCLLWDLKHSSSLDYYYSHNRIWIWTEKYKLVIKDDSPPDFLIFLEVHVISLQEFLGKTFKNMRIFLLEQIKVHINPLSISNNNDQIHDSRIPTATAVH